MFDQILDLVGQPPGSLVYHFIILFAVEAAFAISIGQWMRERSSGTFRLTVGIFGILCARVVVLLASLLAWQGYLPRNILLPPVERLADVITIIAVGWMFATMDDPELLRRNFVPDVFAGLLFGLAMVAFGGTYYFWSVGTAGESLFNSLWIDSAWAIAEITLAAFGLAFMAARARYVYDPFLKGIMLLLLAAAAVLHLANPVLGDVPAAMRVGQLVVMPMLAAVAYRHVVEQLLHWDEFEPSRISDNLPVPAVAPAMVASPAQAIEAPAPPIDTPPAPPEPPPGSLEQTVARKPEPPPAPPSAGPQLLEVMDAVGGLLSTLEPSQIVEEAPRVVAVALRADICVLAVVDEQVLEAAILGGYDNISQSPLRRDVLDLADHPTIVNALGRLRQMRLTVQRNRRELTDLYNRLQITHDGPAYIQPLVKDDERIGVLVVGSPYSRRMLSNDERNLLDRLGPLVTAALLNTESFKEAQEQAELASTAEAAHAAELADEVTAKTAELNAAERQMEEMKAYIRDLHRQLENVPQQQAVAREQIQKLGEEIEQLRVEAGRSRELEREIDTLREKAAAQAADPTSFQRQLDDVRREAQAEIIALRARLMQASISQQEVAFLQEQFAAKAREVITLQMRVTEAQAVSDALREQVGSASGNMRELETLQERVGTQAAEIARLQTQLEEAEAASKLDDQSLRIQQEMDQIDRNAMTQLQVQLAERAALIDELQKKLGEKQASNENLQAHMAEVNTSLQSLQDELTHRTEEIESLQKSLARTRALAQERIAALEAELESGSGDEAEIDRARLQALEAELAEKTTAIETLQGRLEQARHSMGSLEEQISATHEAVDQAIADTEQATTHDEVIASLAQELRTPMSSIMGYTELLLRESVGILGPLQRKFLQRVKANTERMGALLDDLIRITTLDTGQMALEPEKVDVFYAIEEVITNVTNQYNERGLVLRLTLPEELPPITADRGAVVEVIQHLLANAALASPEKGDVELAATVTYATLISLEGEEHESLCLEVAVADSGSGIAPDEYERVFMRKYRADNPLIEGLGDTGVGLSLARALVEAHGGKIWLESERGSGSVFHVLLPLDIVMPALPSQEAES